MPSDKREGSREGCRKGREGCREGCRESCREGKKGREGREGRETPGMSLCLFTLLMRSVKSKLYEVAPLITHPAPPSFTTLSDFLKTFFC